jgi:phosphopantothenoylcysteine decarboxylase/phosphopantothenate--cysteine ligase
MKSFKILVGVTGGIAVYKVCEVVRLLVKGGHEVRVVMTENAKEFVTPLTFEVLSRNPVPEGMFSARHDPLVSHIETSTWCDLFLLAPATANLIGKLASGIADDLLTTIALAVPLRIPAFLAPAMNTNMWAHPVVQRNLHILSKGENSRYRIIPPVEKELACGDVGVGGLADPEEIVRTLKEACG